MFHVKHLICRGWLSDTDDTGQKGKHIMKVRVTKYKAIFLDEESGKMAELEGGYTGTKLKTDLSEYAKENGLKLLAVFGRSKAVAEIDAPLFIEMPDSTDEGEEAQSND